MLPLSFTQGQESATDRSVVPLTVLNKGIKPSELNCNNIPLVTVLG